MKLSKEQSKRLSNFIQKCSYSSVSDCRDMIECFLLQELSLERAEIVERLKGVQSFNAVSLKLIYIKLIDYINELEKDNG